MKNGENDFDSEWISRYFVLLDDDVHDEKDFGNSSLNWWQIRMRNFGNMSLRILGILLVFEKKRNVCDWDLEKKRNVCVWYLEMMEIDENLKARTVREEERRGWFDGEGEKEKELEFLGVFSIIYYLFFNYKIKKY